MTQKIFTNCFLVKLGKKGTPVQVCLAMKKRGFGEGKWNGSGGKPEAGESVEDAARREVDEEFGVKVRNLTKSGEIDFYMRKEDKSVLMHAFLATEWEGDPAETEEMKPKWFAINEVPYDKMWESDREWLPIILSGKRITARYTYTCEDGKLESKKIEEI